MKLKSLAWEYDTNREVWFGKVDELVLYRLMKEGLSDSNGKAAKFYVNFYFDNCLDLLNKREPRPTLEAARDICESHYPAFIDSIAQEGEAKPLQWEYIAGDGCYHGFATGKAYYRLRGSGNNETKYLQSPREQKDNHDWKYNPTFWPDFDLTLTEGELSYIDSTRLCEKHFAGFVPSFFVGGNPLSRQLIMF